MYFLTSHEKTLKAVLSIEHVRRVRIVEFRYHKVTFTNPKLTKIRSS